MARIRKNRESALGRICIDGSSIPSLFPPEFLGMLNMISGNHSEEVDTKYIPERILKSGTATIVFWKDGTKTIVKLPEGDTPDDYSAFTAALAKKVFGSNSKVKKVMRTKTEVQKAKEGKKDETISIPAESTTADTES